MPQKASSRWQCTQHGGRQDLESPDSGCHPWVCILADARALLCSASAQEVGDDGLRESLSLSHIPWSLGPR